MKIRNISSNTVFYIETDTGTYTRHSRDNWTQQMGESDEPVYDCSHLEDAFMDWYGGQEPDYAACMLSILDSLKLFDKGSLALKDETLSEMMFRKMSGYNIDLNKALGFDHLEPVKHDGTRLDSIAAALRDKFGECIIDEGDEDRPGDWWLEDVTVQDIVDFINEQIWNAGEK
jgi:hypothetical protein